MCVHVECFAIGGILSMAYLIIILNRADHIFETDALLPNFRFRSTTQFSTQFHFNKLLIRVEKSGIRQHLLILKVGKLYTFPCKWWNRMFLSIIITYSLYSIINSIYLSMNIFTTFRDEVNWQNLCRARKIKNNSWDLNDERYEWKWWNRTTLQGLQSFLFLLRLQVISIFNTFMNGEEAEEAARIFVHNEFPPLR